MIVADDGNQQKLHPGGRQGPHVGFLAKLANLWRMREAVCNITTTSVVRKPDEYSLFVELPCGEVLEFSAAHDLRTRWGAQTETWPTGGRGDGDGS